MKVLRCQEAKSKRNLYSVSYLHGTAGGQRHATINKRMEERITDAETRIQADEESVTEMLKLHPEMNARLTDLEGWSRRENIRIHSVKEGSEDDAPSMVAFVKCFLRHKLRKLRNKIRVRLEF